MEGNELAAHPGVFLPCNQDSQDVSMSQLDLEIHQLTLCQVVPQTSTLGPFGFDFFTTFELFQLFDLSRTRPPVPLISQLALNLFISAIFIATMLK